MTTSRSLRAASRRFEFALPTAEEKRHPVLCYDYEVLRMPSGSLVEIEGDEDFAQALAAEPHVIGITSSDEVQTREIERRIAGRFIE